MRAQRAGEKQAGYHLQQDVEEGEGARRELRQGERREVGRELRVVRESRPGREGVGAIIRREEAVVEEIDRVRQEIGEGIGQGGSHRDHDYPDRQCQHEHA